MTHKRESMGSSPGRILSLRFARTTQDFSCSSEASPGTASQEMDEIHRGPRPQGSPRPSIHLLSHVSYLPPGNFCTPTECGCVSPWQLHQEIRVWGKGVRIHLFVMILHTAWKCGKGKCLSLGEKKINSSLSIKTNCPETLLVGLGETSLANI